MRAFHSPNFLGSAAVSRFTKLLNDPVRGLHYLRAIYCLNLIYLVLRFAPDYKAPISPDKYRPILLFTFFEAPNAFLLMKMALILLLLVHASGKAGRAVPATAAFLMAMLFGWSYCYGATFYVDSTMVLILIAATILPQIKPDSSEQDIRVNLLLMRFLLIYPFVSAGLSKLRFAGLDWTAAANQRRIYEWNLMLFRDQFSFFSEALQKFFMRQDWFLHLSAIYVLAVECLSPLAFFGRRFAAVLIPAMLSMHIGFAIVLSHNFFMFIWPLYLYWLPWNASGGVSSHE